jgi:replicative DNA helicase Mcm
MITTLDQNDMEKIAKDWVWANNTLYLNMMDRYIQRTDYRFPLDIKDLEDLSNLNPRDVESRFTAIFKEAVKLPEKQRKEVLAKVEKQYVAEAARAANHELAANLLKYLFEQPEEMLKQLNAALYDLMVQIGDEEKEDFYPPEFEILNLESRSINALNYDRLGKLVSVGGWIAYLENPPHIEYQEKYYKCPACGTAKLYSGTPKSCASCGYSKALEFDASQSKGEKVQELYVMENYEEVFQADSNGTEGLISVLVTGNNINKYQIGDRVRVTGIVQLMKKKVLAYLAIKAMGVQIDGNAHLDISKEEIAQIDAISKDPFKFIRDNFASSIIGEKYDIIKESLALAIAGGADSEKRKNIHILMVGNPGAGKSELLKAVEKDSPKAFYVSDASGPGLTAAITDIGGSRVMIPGILPLANNGVACLDELDKMKREDTQAMHSAMEQGEFMKSKAGLKMKFTTRTTIIAAANPVNSSFDANRTILEQITLPESLLQRFDVVWILLDDGNLDPEAILSSTEKSDNPILKKYFSYIQRINPDISPVTKEISEFFNELRGKSGDLALNARMLLSMKRLVQASAKMHMRTQASIQDFQEMEKIITSYLQYFNFSITNITTPGSLKDLVWRLLDLFRTQKQWKRDDLLHQAAMPENEFDRCIAILKNEGKIYEKSNGRYELI